ncbi:uncharacterized protein LOC114727661 [Neltuma alba]|uniref:uncharacterized protein LOC114727661 n=1 Tax=Neltuma alba TaxID=207710 RepID=UPI0010A51B2C|nr:uncharacterized protein LOC114727661 [Prosopis alba]
MSQRGIKSTIIDLVRGDRLNGDNYSMWHHKISYTLEEYEVADVLTTFLSKPETNASRRDQDGYTTWKRRDTITIITMLSAMTDDVLVQSETHPSASAMWAVLKSEFDSISAARLRRLTIKLDNFKRGPNTPIRHHLRAIQNLIRELKEAEGALSDE